MGARNQYSSINFLGGFIEGILIVNFCGRFLHCCFWLWGKLVEYPRLLIISPRLLNNFWNLPRCAKCKSPLHGPHNYVDQTCEQSANYSARTFSCYCAKSKCNFAVCPLYDRSTMLGRLLQTVHVWVCFFGEETKTKYCLGIRKNIWDNGRSRINFLRALNAQCVTRLGTVFFGKIPWSISPWIFHLWSVTLGFHTTVAKGSLVWPDSKEKWLHWN